MAIKLPISAPSAGLEILGRMLAAGKLAAVDAVGMKIMVWLALHHEGPITACGIDALEEALGAGEGGFVVAAYKLHLAGLAEVRDGHDGKRLRLTDQ